MEELKFSDYVIMCSDFEKNPENTELLEKIEEFVSKIEVREYLPLKDKEMVTMEIITSISPDFDAPAVAAFLEVGRISKALLTYCVNLEIDLPIMSYNYFITDAIYEYGLYDAIYSRCEKDFNRLSKMIDDVVNASNIYHITETASLFDKESYENWIDSMNKLKDTLDSDSVKALLEVIGTESIEGKDLLTAIGEMAMERTNKQIEDESVKFEKAAEFYDNPDKEEEDEKKEGDSEHVS